MTKAGGDTQASPSGEEIPMTAIIVALIVALERSGVICDGMHRAGAQMDWWLAAVKSPQPAFAGPGLDESGMMPRLSGSAISGGRLAQARKSTIGYG